MPEAQWTGEELKDKKLYHQIISKLEKEGKLIVLFYDSLDWKNKRIEILDRDDHLCQYCKKKIATEVHHINSAIYNPEICLKSDNLRSSCNTCHPKKKQRNNRNIK